MTSKNSVFIARSLDGFIAGKNGEIDWLHSIPNPDNIDMGYKKFMSDIDALVMGRKTFETVCSFPGAWPYDRPVFVWSNRLSSISQKYQEHTTLVRGEPNEILQDIHKKGYYKLYIDGGGAIHSFLQDNLIDEMIITTIPVILGGGIPLFRELPERIPLKLLQSQVFLEQMVQDHYVREKMVF